MRIPEIQERMRELASECGMPELRMLADAMSRRPVNRRSATVSRKCDEAVRSEIRLMAEKHPDLPLARIAVALNVNPGRVSEALRGYRR